MESIFVGEGVMDLHQWTHDDSDFHKLKVGEIFQLSDSSLSMTCLNCLQEFQYFTEFTLHIQEHYLRGEIATLKQIKEEAPIHVENTTPEHDVGEEIHITPEVKVEVFENEIDDYYDDNSEPDAGWSDEDFEQSSHRDFEAEEGIEMIENMSESLQNASLMIEGTDYEKVNNKFKCLTCDHETEKWKHIKEHLQTHSNPKEIICPLCFKLFATVSYVRKHVNRTHNLQITANQIKEAQLKNDKSMIAALPINRKTEKKIYDEGVDYKKIDDKFQCLTCDRKMAKFDHMKEHLLTHTSKKNIYCPYCARAFITESYVRKHVNRTHKKKITTDEIKMAQLSIDVRQIRKEWEKEKDKNTAKIVKTSKLNSVAAPAEEGAIACFFCSKTFTKPRYAQKHMRLIHAKPMKISEVVNCQAAKSVASVNVEIKEENHVQNENVVAEANMVEAAKNFECFECHKQFVSANSMRIHMKLHSGIKYSCPHCGKLFAMKSYVRDHIVIMHGIKRDDIPKESIRQASGDFVYTTRPVVDLYECYLCKNTYRKRNRLRDHMHSHISGPYLCVICGAVYKSTDTLRHHMERHKANPEEPHHCPECGKMYPTRRYMLSHYRTIHLNKKRKKVTIEKTFNIKCQFCDKKFQNQHNLKQHLMVHNRDPNELTCHICGWEFKERSNLKQHMESHGNNKTTCEVCNKVLSIRYLQEHKKIHMGNKEFQCSTCGKQFVSRERLKRHMVRHYGELKFKCDLCPKAYTRSDKLLYHRRTHDQQMTHTCHRCGKGFFSIKSLRKHENKHYLEDNGILKSSTTPDIDQME